MAGDVVISEFMAINGTTVADEDGDFSDWIELHNTAAAPVDLGGWYLTDNANNPTKWRFPSVTLPADGYLLVFASNKNRAVAGQPLHTNFQLDGDGEYLGLVRPDGVTRAYEFAPAYPPQETDVSYGIGPARSAVTALVGSPATVRYTVPDATTGAGWAAGDFDDSGWASGATGVGFEAAAGVGAPLPEESEPNDTVGGADDASRNFQPLGGADLFQVQVRGTLTSSGDTDFYSLGRLEPGDVLSVAQSASDSARGSLRDSQVELYRAGAPGTPLRVSDDEGTGFDSLIHRYAITVADTYYVRARSFQDSLSGTYDVSAWLENGGGTPAPATGAAAAESEPNDTLAAADDLSSAWRAVQYRSSTTGSVSTGSGRTDYFAYKFNAGDLVTVLVDSTSGLDATATLVNFAGTPLARDTGDNDLSPP
jgi:hypothetical protein